MSIEKILGTVKSFLDFILGFIYEYLDSLTLLKEGALEHLLIFTTLFLSMLDIIYIVLGNENVKIFDIKKFLTRLFFILNVKDKFQTNLLVWSLFLIFVICLFGMILNLFISL